jgi:methyl-accepting chemotaxis protein
MANDLTAQLAFSRITGETSETLRQVWPLIDAAMTPLLDLMYDHILRQPELKALFTNDSIIKSARERQHQHWRRLFSGSYDQEYIASVRRIAITHARIGLEPSFYISTYLLALEEIHALVINAYGRGYATNTSRRRLEHALRAIDRAVMFDLQLVVSGFLEENAAAYRRRLGELADQFGGVIDTFTDGVTVAVRGLNASSEEMLTAANTATTAAGGLSASADQSSMNMGAVASAAEQITASIAEISRQTQQAAVNTGAAVETVSHAEEVVNTLNVTAARIGDVVNLIQSIAGQTNLLALNATIEAARAGDAGRGFAVVAGEVKALSGQTARATEDIRVQVDAVRGVVAQIAEAMGGIVQAVERIRESTTSIAGAVEQQGAATREISQSVAAAAAGAAEITEGARNLASVAGQTAGTARDVANASADLTKRTVALTGQATDFIGKIRTADRRDEPRQPVAAEGRMIADGVTLNGLMVNISNGGAAIRADATRLPTNPREIRLIVLGAIDAPMRVVNASGGIINLAFLNRAQGETAARWFASRADSKSLAA